MSLASTSVKRRRNELTKLPFPAFCSGPSMNCFLVNFAVMHLCLHCAIPSLRHTFCPPQADSESGRTQHRRSPLSLAHLSMSYPRISVSSSSTASCHRRLGGEYPLASPGAVRVLTCFLICSVLVTVMTPSPSISCMVCSVSWTMDRALLTQVCRPRRWQRVIILTTTNAPASVCA